MLHLKTIQGPTQALSTVFVRTAFVAFLLSRLSVKSPALVQIQRSDELPSRLNVVGGRDCVHLSDFTHATL